MSIIHGHMSLTRLRNLAERTDMVHLATLSRLTTSDSSNLGTAMHTATDYASPHHNIGLIDITLITIATTEDVSIILQATDTVAHRPGLIIQLLNEITIDIVITDIAIVESHIGRSIDSTATASLLSLALTAAINVTLDGRYAIIITILIVILRIGIIAISCSLILQVFHSLLQTFGYLVLTNTDDDICLSRDITHCSGIEVGIHLYHQGISLLVRHRITVVIQQTFRSFVLTHATFVSATKHITDNTCSDIGRSRSFEGITVLIRQITVTVKHRTDRTCSNNILLNQSTKQSDIGSAIDITTSVLTNGTHATTIGIATANLIAAKVRTNNRALVDDDIGIIFPAIVTWLCQRILQTVLLISIANSQAFIGKIIKFLHRHPAGCSHITNTTILTTTVDNISLCPFIEVHLRIL